MVNKRVVVLVALTVLLLGCAGQQPTTPTTPAQTTPAETPPATKAVTIGTGGVGGIYIYYGSGVASIVSKYTDISANAVQTKASVDNLLYIAKSPEDTIGLVMGSTAMEAWNGKIEAFNKQPQKWLRVLWVMYPNVQHIVTTADSGIKTVYDLKGKRVSTGAPGSGTERDAFATLTAAGIDPEKDFTVWQKLGAKESADALLDGKIDAYFWNGGIPTGSIVELATNLQQRGKQIAFVEIPDEVIQKMKEENPGVYVTFTMKKEYYGSPEDITTTAIQNVVIAHENMDEEVAYKIVKAVFDHLGELHAVHDAAKQTTLESAVTFEGIPYHPGAVKYFKEKGIMS